MITIVNINSERFTFNGIPYYKNFMGIVAGDYIHIVNIYDSKIALTKDGPVKYDEFTVNGISYASAALLQGALLPVLYTRGTLGGGGSVGNLQQVLQQGPEANIDAGDGHTFIARLPYIDPNGIDKQFNLYMAYENAGTTVTSGLYSEAGFTQLNSSFGDATSSRTAQIGAPIPSQTEGEFNNILQAFLQRIISGTTINSSYNITYPTPVEGTSVVVRFPHILMSGIYDLATQQWASDLVDNKKDSFIVRDRSLTSTIVGCGSFVTRRIKEIDCGEFVIVDFDLDGVGTATTFTFTLSFNAAFRNSGFIARRNNNATFVQGAVRTSPGSNVVTLFQDMNSSTWTASGNRTAIGQIIVFK
ncbi:MAG: hypothetical protein O9259_06220 [Flavobacterium sp.]|jgi:hypothetical protein|nr:hypothetical protein [Flavobacterium sp.]